VVFFVGIAWPVADAERGCRLTAILRQWEPFVRAARLYIEEADAPLSVEKTIGRPMKGSRHGDQTRTDSSIPARRGGSNEWRSGWLHSIDPIG